MKIPFTLNIHDYEILLQQSSSFRGQVAAFLAEKNPNDVAVLARQCNDRHGNNKLAAIKELRSLAPGLGLAEAKTAIEADSALRN